MADTEALDTGLWVLPDFPNSLTEDLVVHVRTEDECPCDIWDGHCLEGDFLGRVSELPTRDCVPVPRGTTGEHRTRNRVFSAFDLGERCV